MNKKWKIKIRIGIYIAWILQPPHFINPISVILTLQNLTLKTLKNNLINFQTSLPLCIECACSLAWGPVKWKIKKINPERDILPIKTNENIQCVGSITYPVYFNLND